MATPEEITPLILQAWQKDPEASFFDVFYDAFHTNETVFSLASMSNEDFMRGWEDYINGNTQGEESVDETQTEAAPEETTEVPAETPDPA